VAITLSILKTEVQRKLQESATASNSMFQNDDYLAWINEFYDLYEADLRLQGGPTDYTWAADTTSVALSTVASDIIQLQSIEVLDSDGLATGTIEPRPRGYSSGVYIWNDTVYINGDAPTSAMTTKWWYFRKATRATVIGDNIDLPSGTERAILVPWFMSQANFKAKKPATAQGYMNMFDFALKRMIKKRNRQFNTPNEVFLVSDDYSPYTG
jgi:hypothetical protein